MYGGVFGVLFGVNLVDCWFGGDYFVVFVVGVGCVFCCLFYYGVC